MIESVPGGIVIDVRVIPRAAKSAVAGTRDGALLVRLQAPPVEGAANAELVEIIAAWLRVPKRSVSLISGEHARTKRVRVVGVDAAAAATRLGVEPT